MAKEGVRDAKIPKKTLTYVGEGNRLRLFNSIDMSMYAGTSWPLTIQTIGEKKSTAYLFRLGYLMGRDAASEMKTVLEKRGSLLPKTIPVIEELISLSGFGVVSIVSYTPKKEVTLDATKTVMFDLAEEKYGAKSLLGHFYAGVYSGFSDILLDFSKCMLSYKRVKSGSTIKHTFSYKK